ncbi:MAG: hypothetical protein AAFN77_17990 [Planctomycetota bacterium]
MSGACQPSSATQDNSANHSSDDLNDDQTLERISEPFENDSPENDPAPHQPKLSK